MSADPLGKYPAAAIRLDRTVLPAKVAITIDRLGPGYGLDLLISTTAGTRLFRLPAPPVMTPKIAEFLVGTVEAQLLRCDKVLGAWFSGVQKFDVAWVVDPLLDPPRETFEHLWNVEVAGLPEGESVSLLNAANEPIMRAVAVRGAPLRLSALVPASDRRELSVALGSDGQRAILRNVDAVPDTHGLAMPHSTRTALSPMRPGPGRDGRGVDIRQQPSSPASSIPLHSRCSHLAPFPLRGGTGIAAVLRDEIVALDLTNPYAPDRRGSWKVEGVRGACTWRQGLLAFGAAGFSAIDDGAAAVAVGAACDAGSVVDVAAGRGVMYVLMPDSLEVRTMNLCPTSAVPHARGRCITRTGRWLVVGGGGGLAVYDTSNAGHLVLSASRDDLDVTALTVPFDGPAAPVVATLTDGSARTFSVQTSHLQEMAVYAERPWFADSLRLGSLLLRLGTDRRHVSVHVVGGSRLVVPMEQRSHAVDVL